MRGAQRKRACGSSSVRPIECFGSREKGAAAEQLSRRQHAKKPRQTWGVRRVRDAVWAVAIRGGGRPVESFMSARLLRATRPSATSQLWLGHLLGEGGDETTTTPALDVYQLLHTSAVALENKTATVMPLCCHCIHMTLVMSHVRQRL